MLWLLLGLLLVILSLVGFLWWMSRNQNLNTVNQQQLTKLNLELLTKMNSQLLQQNQNLFDRVQASDLPTYAAMTHLNNSSDSTTPFNDEYIPRDDQSEYERMAASAGLGESLMDEASTDQDFIDLAGEIGIELKERK